MAKWTYLFCVLLLVVVIQLGHCAVLELDEGNFDTSISSKKLMIVNFYADWCRFSQMLTPVFEEASNQIAAEFPEDVALGRVNCQEQLTVASRFQVNKYPTLKVFRNGQVLKKEYRGQRSPEAFLEFVRNELRPSMAVIDESELVKSISKRSIVGNFPSKESPEYSAFEAASTVLKDDCPFLSVIKEGSALSYGIHAENSVVPEHTFNGNHADEQSIRSFVTDRCVPLVREITFANAEGLTEEGLPFLILFHHPDDTHSVDVFEKQVRQDLMSQRQSVNFIHADGLQFSHPLHHLGKGKQDLPVLAIDSFRHMYVFPGDFHKDIGKPGKVKQFVEDLHSGKLHREFHYGPDPTEHPQLEELAPSDPMATISDGPDAPGIPSDTGERRAPDTEDLGREREHQFRTPPKSAFAKLAPGKNRYTLAGEHDEL